MEFLIVDVPFVIDPVDNCVGEPIAASVGDCVVGP